MNLFPARGRPATSESGVRAVRGTRRMSRARHRRPLGNLGRARVASAAPATRRAGRGRRREASRGRVVRGRRASTWSPVSSRARGASRPPRSTPRPDGVRLPSSDRGASPCTSALGRYLHPARAVSSRRGSRTVEMLRGEKVDLRSRSDADVAVLHAELYDDVPTRSRADSRPWVPLSADSPASPYRAAEPAADVAVFSVVECAGGELAGEALLWGIDLHNRAAHLGVSLRPGFRGRGLSVDVLRVLCRYGFGTRGLHRLQLETLADNQPMIKAATRVGFTHEGTLRGGAWVTARSRTRSSSASSRRNGRVPRRAPSDAGATRRRRRSAHQRARPLETRRRTGGVVACRQRPFVRAAGTSDHRGRCRSIPRPVLDVLSPRRSSGPASGAPAPANSEKRACTRWRFRTAGLPSADDRGSRPSGAGRQL